MIAWRPGRSQRRVLASSMSADKSLAADDIAAERARLGIPENAVQLRSWIRYKLGEIENPATRRPWNQAQIAKETHASEPHVSRVYSGSIESGHLSGRIRRLTSEILGIPLAVLFPGAANGSNGKRGGG